MTIQNLYTQYLDGKITQSKFLYEARRDQNLDMISPSNSFDDVVKILKNKSIISEKAHNEAKKAEGKQEVEIISKTIDMVNPYEYSRGMNYELEIMDIPATSGDLSEENVLKAQKKVLANLTKNSQYYFDKINSKGEVGHEWIEATKKEIEKIGKGKEAKGLMREGIENGLKQMGYSESDIEDFMDEYKQGGSKLPKKVRDYLDGLYNTKLGQLKTKPLRREESSSISTKEIVKALIPIAFDKKEIMQYMQSLSKSGDKFETTDDYVEDFKNYIADKSLEEHGQYADRVADVNADSTLLKEKQEAIYKKYAEQTGIPMENLMSMVREAKAKLQEADDTPEEKKAKDLEIAAEKAKIAASNKKIQDLNQGR